MRCFWIIALICMTVLGKAQQRNVEKSVFGVQTGLLGVWGYNELKLSSHIALRSELGFDCGFWGGMNYDKTIFLMAPVITLEPRLYYNLSERVEKAKKTHNNSGNFVSLKTSFHPDWFVMSNDEDIRVISDISIIPTWGIRRSIGNHFNYEAGVGLGYRYTFAEDAGYNENESEVAWNIHLRMGYAF